MLRSTNTLHHFQLGSTVLSHEELFKIISTLERLAGGVQHGLNKLDNDLGRVASTVDDTKEIVVNLCHDLATTQKDSGGLAAIDHIHRLEVQMQRTIILVCGVFLD